MIDALRQLAFPVPVTVTTISKIMSIDGCNKIGIQFIRANHTAGSSTFIFEVSNDGINFVTYNKLIDNVVNTNAQQLTRVGSVVLSSNTSKVYGVDLTGETYRFGRITCTIATDGDGQAIVEKDRQI